MAENEPVSLNESPPWEFPEPQYSIAILKGQVRDLFKMVQTQAERIYELQQTN